jgi:hypothetical protein
MNVKTWLCRHLPLFSFLLILTSLLLAYQVPISRVETCGGVFPAMVPSTIRSAHFYDHEMVYTMKEWLCAEDSRCFDLTGLFNTFLGFCIASLTLCFAGQVLEFCPLKEKSKAIAAFSSTALGLICLAFYLSLLAVVCTKKTDLCSGFYGLRVLSFLFRRTD